VKPINLFDQHGLAADVPKSGGLESSVDESAAT